MVFSSAVFLFLFLPLVTLVYYNPWIRSCKFRNGILLLASLGFYAWGEPVFVFLMIFSVLLTWGAGLLIDRFRKAAKFVVSLTVFYHIGILFVFKYLGFVMQQFGLLLFHSKTEWEVALPIGISFFTFQMMSYLFDVYYKKAKVQKSFFRLALYVSLFPQLIAGPIVRYNQIEAEIGSRTTSKQEFAEGMERFIYGLGKKVLLSNYLAVVADLIFEARMRSVAAAWLGGISYTLQIYFDFSGYSDMAIGLGKMFGFHFSENFNYPYISKSVTEFWRRWHISLSSWFRDYVYIPLGGNRVSRGRWVFNLFVVWLLTGIWHGANWTFLCWGLFYFVVLLAERLTGFPQKIRWRGAKHLYTLLIVVMAWVLFRSDTIAAALQYIGSMFGIGSNGLVDSLFTEAFTMGAFVIAVACVFSVPVYGMILDKLKKRSSNLEQLCRGGAIITVFILSLIEVAASAYSPFIYFNF